MRKLIYSIKFTELDESVQKDKARIVVQGCIRILRDGRMMLDETFRRPGEFWAPVGSLAVAVLCRLCHIGAVDPRGPEIPEAVLLGRAVHVSN